MNQSWCTWVRHGSAALLLAVKVFSEPRQWVDGASAGRANLEVQVRPRARTGVAHFADSLADLHSLPNAKPKRSALQMPIDADDDFAVDHVTNRRVHPHASVAPGSDDDPIGDRHNGPAVTGSDVDTGVPT